jgi:hypothetical protein
VVGDTDPGRETPTRATWGVRSGRSTRRVLRGGKETSDIAARLVHTYHASIETGYFLTQASYAVFSSAVMSVRASMAQFGFTLHRGTYQYVAEYSQYLGRFLREQTPVSGSRATANRWAGESAR